MKKRKLSAWILTGMVAALPFSAHADNPSNYGTNKSSPPPSERNAGDQSNARDKIEVTRRIRERIVNDKSLSTAAHNITIVTTDDGDVTIRGPVASNTEKVKIMEIASAVVPGARIHDEITVNATH